MSAPVSTEISPHAPALPETISSAEPSCASVEVATEKSIRKENRRVLVLVCVVAAFMVVAHFTPLGAWITQVQVWKERLRDLGWAGEGVFAAACAVGVMLGLPRLPLCAAAGLLFGFGEGMLASLAGSVAGSYGAFLLARAGARRAVLARAERSPWLGKLLERPTLARVFWARQLMVPGILLNVLLGVGRCGHRVFLTGTLAGHLPLNVVFSLVGSGLGKDSLAHTLAQLLGALAAVHLLGWLLWRMLRREKTA